MAIFFMVNTVWVNHMEQAHISGKMVILTKVNLIRELDKDKETYGVKTWLIFMENLRRRKFMASVKLSMQTGIRLKAIMKILKEMGRVS